MKLKDRIKSYSFWVSLSSAIILLLRLLGQQFGFSIDESLFSDIFTTLCGILVILGIIAPPSAKTQTTSSTSESNSILQENTETISENNSISEITQEESQDESNETQSNQIYENDSSNETSKEIVTENKENESTTIEPETINQN